MNFMSKIGAIDVGGGFRDIYGCGVLDACLDTGVHFDYCIGVSAGSANMASYLAGQRGRNYRFYETYGFRKQYASFRNFLLKRNFVDLDYVYSTLSNEGGEDPLDWEAFARNPAEFICVATHAETGETIYWDKTHTHRNNYDILKASSALPGVGQPYVVEGVPCFDGGFADPIPLKKAFADGCDKVVLILSKTRDTLRTQDKDRGPAKMIRRRYPRAAEQLLLRWQKYNDGVAYAKQLEQEGKVLIIAPNDTCGVDTLKRTPESMDALYRKGVEDGKTIPAFVEA